MPLVQASLATAIASVFSAKLPDPQQVAQQLATAYTTYASAGLFATGVPVLGASQTSAMKGQLYAAISDPRAGVAARFALAWSTGLTAFWAGVTVAGAQPGVVTAIPGASAVVAPITAALLNIASTEQITANVIATAVHAASLTTLATVTNLAPPPPTIVVTLV